MKKIFSYATMLLVGLCVFTSCEDDRDSNPVLVQPTSFVLNNPAVGAGTVDLSLSTGFDLSWSQPQFTEPNAPVIATYTTELSTTGSFTKAYNADADDNTGADYIALDETNTTCTATISADAVAKALQQLNNYPEGQDLPSQTLYIREKAAVQDAGYTEYSTIYSNTVQLTILPYYVELKDASVEMWYILGSCIGDAAWTNKADACGTSNFPMFMVDGYAYDKKTGQGEIEMVNYFEAGQGFKILPSDYSWDTGLCADGSDGTAKYRNNGDDGGDIKAAADGYYRFVINTAKKTAKFEEYDAGTPAVYDAMAISGSFNDWSDTNMTPVFTSANNHVWCYVLSCSEYTEFKFKIVGSWDTNWGSNTFPTGIGTNNGNNIPVEAGKWVIMFNDLTGAYSITSAE